MNAIINRLIVCLAVAVLPFCLHAQEPPQARPNFLLLVADDLAFTDLGAFGGEIDTPNLNALAARGVKLTSFYTAPTCSPTRAMLLSGEDAHKVGLGMMAEALPMIPGLGNNPGYEGYLDPGVVTIADRLAGAGYRTLMTGKWHLGLTPEFSPRARGFQRSLVLLQGGADHFGAYQTGSGQSGEGGVTYQEDGAPTRYPPGVFSGDFFTAKMLEYLQRDSADKRPFFAYLAFTEPHWPLQAPDNLIDKYKGRYDAGPTALREARFARMKELGLLDETLLSTRPGTITAWDSLSAQQRAVAARAMEVYAAMVDNLDQNVGRVLAALAQSGELDNTVIIFMSDNGAEGLEQDALNGILTHMGIAPDILSGVVAANTDPATMGRPGSYVTYGPDWAQASTGPFRLFKGTTNEGGIRSPAFVTGPGIAGGRIYSGAVSVRDIMPTLLELAGEGESAAGAAAPAAVIPTGISWVPMLDADPTTTIAPHTVLGWELFFRRGLRRDHWKAVFSQLAPTLMSRGLPGAAPPQWRLYDLSVDPGEEHDLASSEPEILEGLVADWNRYAAANGVVAIPKRPPANVGK
ncbi:MAG: arylsulfatase [Halioglobus sp.]